ncbi:nuclear transport factor 2 family protein [Nocardia sp. R6R-6]|uniref:nuclear transport factor 2 family protein n=1 Tax=Nocardia sp. R6R-6 TaxID=3459303 RepID=UPI00403DD57D
MTTFAGQDELDRLVARVAIQEQLQNYCRAADRQDEAAFRAVFHPDARCVLGQFEGSVDDFVARGFRFLRGCVLTEHFVVNQTVEVRGHEARAVSYLLAFHRIAAETPGDGPWSGHTHGSEEVLWTGGRYLDDFELRDGSWRIVRRELGVDWEQWQPSDVRSFVNRDAPGRGPR